MGLREIEKKLRTKSSYQRKDAEVLLDEIDRMIENIGDLKEKLKDFEKKNKDQIRDNEDYYSKISTLREELGLPKEIGVYEWKDSPSIKDKITGDGYYNQLANEILVLGREKIKKTGGLMSVAEIVIQLNQDRPGKLVNPKDIIKAIEKLESTGLVQGREVLESGVEIVEFVTLDLSDDQEKILDMASRKGYVTPEMILMRTGWTTERTNTILKQLEDEGMAIKEENMQEGTKYWFPSFGDY